MPSEGSEGRGELQIEADVERILEELYGRVDWRRASGVVQVTAIAAADRATIALGPEAPVSAFDRFVLGFARARTDAIVSTGAILRAEPELVHCYAEDAVRNAEWTQWRASVLERSSPPGLILLSRSGDFPLDHPALEAAPSGILWTSASVRDRLGPRVGALEVVAAEEVAEKITHAATQEVDRGDGAGSAAGGDAGAQAGIAMALAYARTQCGLGRIAIEAGPSVTQALYAASSQPGQSAARIDELLLSLYHGELAPAARAAAFASEAQLAVQRLERLSQRDVEEPSGRWSFARYRVSASANGDGAA
jgi:hypothetical protein